MNVTYSFNGTEISKSELQKIAIHSEAFRRVQLRLKRESAMSS